MHMQDLPSGFVTILFTDIEGSTKLCDRHQELFRGALETHNRLMREAIKLHCGYEVKTIGDSFMVAFSEPLHAANCALEMQRSIEGELFPDVGKMRVRIGMHSGELIPQNGDYFGTPVNHAARIEATAHGGQIILSEEMAEAVSERLPSFASIKSAGLHRLKDLGSPIRLFRLSASDLPDRDYPPLRTLNLYPNNLPSELTSFVGREKEVGEVIKLSKGNSLVNITGQPGIGKSRLALQAAAECAHRHPDGACLIDMNEIADTSEVLEMIASALKIAPSFDEFGIRTLSFLRDKKILVILIHCNPNQEIETWINEALNSLSGAFFLVASQSRISSPFAVEFKLIPFEIPSTNLVVAEAMNSSSVRLFVETAQSLRPSFELTPDNLPSIIEICSFLAGIPGKIEESARRVRGMTPQQILPRLKREGSSE